MLATVENIFRINGALGHEIVFVYRGRLDPLPRTVGATLRGVDGSQQPLVWRPIHDDREPLPLYPDAVAPWVRGLADRGRRGDKSTGQP